VVGKIISDVKSDSENVENEFRIENPPDLKVETPEQIISQSGGLPSFRGKQI